MQAGREGCDICRLSARADRRLAVVEPIACRHGPEYLKRCGACGGFWRETLRYEAWLPRAEAEAVFGGPLPQAPEARES